MYRLRHMELHDKVREHVDLSLVEHVYPKEVIKECIQQSGFWNTKPRRVRQTTALSLVWFIIAMGLWSRLNQCGVWQKLVGKLSVLHPAQGQGHLSDSGISARRKELGSEPLRALMARCCRLIAQPRTIPSAFFGRYRLMAVDATLLPTPDTLANEQAFGRSSNQYGKGAYPQVRAVMLVECGTHAVVGLELSRYEVSEVHGAHRLLTHVGKEMLVMADAGISSGGWLEGLRAQRAHGLGALQAGVWDRLPRRRRLCDGSILLWVPPSRKGSACYPLTTGLWVRIISYQLTDERLGEPGKVYRLVTTLLNPVTAPALSLVELYHERWEIELVMDEIKTHERQQRKLLRSRTPEGIEQEIYGIVLAHYLVRVLMAQAAIQGQHDPDRLSFTQGLFQLTEMMDLALVLDPQAAPGLLSRLYERMSGLLLPERRLRINRREVKQVYNKYPPKKRHPPPAQPFDPQERFLDFVVLFDPLAACLLAKNGS